MVKSRPKGCQVTGAHSASGNGVTSVGAEELPPLSSRGPKGGVSPLRPRGPGAAGTRSRQAGFAWRGARVWPRDHFRPPCGQSAGFPPLQALLGERTEGSGRGRAEGGVLPAPRPLGARGLPGTAPHAFSCSLLPGRSVRFITLGPRGTEGRCEPVLRVGAGLKVPGASSSWGPGFHP